MLKQYQGTPLNMSIAITDFILENNGHSIAEAAIEFNCSRSTIQRSINFLGSVAFYGSEPNEHELKLRYVKVKKTLARLAKENNPNNIGKWNSSKKVVSQ